MSTKKNSKSAGDSINSKLQLVVKSGKFTLGYKSVCKNLREGKAVVILVADNCPKLEKSMIEYLALLSKTSVHQFAGNNVNLGTAFGKLFGVSVCAILDAGDADISSLMQ